MPKKLDAFRKTIPPEGESLSAEIIRKRAVFLHYLAKSYTVAKCQEFDEDDLTEYRKCGNGDTLSLGDSKPSLWNIAVQNRTAKPV